jgi:hypothetical protein
MASEILGLFTSPEMYRQQQDRMMQEQAVALAQLDPYQSVRFGAVRAGQQFGQGLAGLLGAQDPQLAVISRRQALSQQLDPSDPDSILAAAQQAAEAGDQQFALSLADYARKAQSDLALVQRRTREGRAAATPKELQIAGERARLLQQRRSIEALPVDAPDRAEALQLIDDTLAGLPATAEAAPKFGENVETKSFELFDKPYARLTPAERKSVNDSLEKPDKDQTFGVDREAEAAARYGKTFAQLTQTEKAVVNKVVEEQKGRIAEKGAPKLPGQGKEGVKDVPGFRDKVINTIDPFRKTVTATDQALTNIQDSLKTNNFASYRAAQTQFARAISGAGDLSQRELKAAGADPSLLGGTADYLSTLFTSTPSKDTQTKMLNTLKAIRSVAAKKAKDEISNQKKIASRAGYNQEDTDLIFNFPEFEPRGKATTRTLKSGKTVTITED